MGFAEIVGFLFHTFDSNGDLASSLSVVMAGFDAAESEYAAQLVPDSVVITGAHAAGTPVRTAIVVV